MSYLIFIDFDGTMTVNDVGYEMFRKFTGGATEPLVQSYRRGEVNSLNCLSGECDLWNLSAPNPEEVWNFLDNQGLRPGLDGFLKELNEKNVKPLILSEGFDFYIDRILEFHGLVNLNRISNSARFENGRLFPEFPFHEVGCGECSNCKGYHIRRLRSRRDCAVYIGDGHSDFHASRAADIVFARSHLKELLLQNKKGFFPYNDFFDVGHKLKEIIRSELFTTSARINFHTFSERHRMKIRSLWENGEVMRFVGYPNGLGWSEALFDSFWEKIFIDDGPIRLAMEDRSGAFLGEAMIAPPGENGYSEPDIKLLPEYWGKGLAFEAWGILLDRTASRWPGAAVLVTPNIENQKALGLYQRLGFEFDGEEQEWQPSREQSEAIPVRYRRMIKKDIASNGRL